MKSNTSATDSNTKASSSLGRPHRNGENKRTWNSEPFIKPVLKKDQILQKISTNFNATEVLLKKWFSSKKKFSKADDFHNPTSEWKLITTASAEVILDPNTASPTLMLSQDGRRLRTKIYKETDPQNVLQRKHPQYDSWPCVQAKEGYLTGRHFWEVDVKGKCDWSIGVVKESAPRKGFVNMNTSTGYWTLRLQLGSLMAMTTPVTKLNQANPTRIGVLLDLYEGKVSFYDTAKRKHIYTFKADFKKSGKIYPVFGTVETDKSLKILSGF